MRDVIRRVVRDALALAAGRRRLVAVIPRANALPRSTGMFLELVHELAEEFHGVWIDDFLVDDARRCLCVTWDAST